MPTDARQLRDELLVLHCQLGEPTAFDELIGRWEARLLYYLRRLVPQVADAWDSLQRTWLAVFRDVRHLKKPRAPTSPRKIGYFGCLRLTRSLSGPAEISRQRSGGLPSSVLG